VSNYITRWLLELNGEQQTLGTNWVVITLQDPELQALSGQLAT
jgi:hypothetical protein